MRMSVSLSAAVTYHTNDTQNRQTSQVTTTMPTNDYIEEHHSGDNKVNSNLMKLKQRLIQNKEKRMRLDTEVSERENELDFGYKTQQAFNND